MAVWERGSQEETVLDLSSLYSNCTCPAEVLFSLFSCVAVGLTWSVLEKEVCKVDGKTSLA